MPRFWLFAWSVQDSVLDYRWGYRGNDLDDGDHLLGFDLRDASTAWSRSCWRLSCSRHTKKSSGVGTHLSVYPIRV